LNQKTLYIVRHGQTDYNLNGMVQGSGIDAPLNQTGRAQAQQFFEAYKEHPFDKVYISSLQRTRQSVLGFLDFEIPYKELTGLNEISWGDQEGKPFTEEASTLYHQTVKDWQAGKLTSNVGGGESPLEVMARQQVAMKHILNQPAESEVLVCMHGRAMRILLTWLQNKPLTAMDQIEHANLGLYKVRVVGDQVSILERNNTSHL
jgi:broad specificity phosphatase PhoE